VVSPHSDEVAYSYKWSATMIAVLAVAVSETSRSYWFGRYDHEAEQRLVRFKAKLDRLHPQYGKPTQLAMEFAEEEQDSGRGL
jgi:hypothetical protein